MSEFTMSPECGHCGEKCSPRALLRDGRRIGSGTSCLACGYGTLLIPNEFERARVLRDLRDGVGPRHEDVHAMAGKR